MRRVPRGWWITLAVLVIVLPALITVIVTEHPSNHESSTPPPPNVVRTTAKIPVADNVNLTAEVFTPRHGATDAPLVVMPSPWGGAESKYEPIADHLAGDGYDVVAYTQRGFLNSGGDIDFAGPTTQQDA